MTGANIPREYFPSDLSSSEKSRIQALQDQNAYKYYSLCNELGISEIEDSLLYEIGQLDAQRLEEGTVHISQLEQRVLSDRCRNCSVETYEHFLNEVNSLGVHTNINEWAST
jgi:hypothetical protein